MLAGIVCYNLQDYNSNDILYQNNCYAPTGDEINDGEDSHEIFSIDGDHFLLPLWTIKNQENLI